MQVLSSQHDYQQPLSSRDTPKACTRVASRYDNKITSTELLDQLRLKLQQEQQEQKKNQTSLESQVQYLKEQIQIENSNKQELQDQVNLLTQKFQNLEQEMVQKEFNHAGLEKEIKLLQAELEKEKSQKHEFEKKCKINDVLVTENKQMLDTLVEEQQASKKMAMSAEINQVYQKQIESLIVENGSLTKRINELQSQIKIIQSNEQDQKQLVTELNQIKEKYSALQESQKIYQEKQQNILNSVKKDMEVENSKKIQALEQKYQRERIEQNQIIADLKKKNSDSSTKINQTTTEQLNLNKQTSQQRIQQQDQKDNKKDEHKLPNVEYLKYQSNLSKYQEDRKSYLSPQSQSSVLLGLEKEKNSSIGQGNLEQSEKNPVKQDYLKSAYVYKQQDQGSKFNLLTKK